VDIQLLIAVLAGTIVSATPLLFSAMGEIIAELSGMMNLSIEGLMMVGAMSGYAVSSLTGSLWLGVVAGVLGGAFLALLFGLLTINLRIHQVVTGLAMGLFAEGVARFLGRPFIGQALPAMFIPIHLPVLGDVPFVGPIFFNQNVFVYFSYVLVPVVWYVVYRTKVGLSLRAAGERPRAAEVVGVNVYRVRHVAVMLGGALAGLAGAFLSIGWLNGWTEGMTAGRGWIALALVIVAGWNPGKVILGAYLFGFTYIMAVQTQTITGLIGKVPVYLVQMAPYLAAIAFLAVIGRSSLRHRIGSPTSLTIPYSREER